MWFFNLFRRAPPVTEYRCAHGELTTIAVHPSARTIVDIDLSYNELRNLDGLAQFTRLKTLVLDGNNISSLSHWPSLPELSLLWVNKNKIDDLADFVAQLGVSAPRLKVLSMLGNPACQTAGIGSEQYHYYRIFVIARLPSLQVLDSMDISREERSEARCMYGGIPIIGTSPAGQSLNAQAGDFAAGSPSTRTVTSDSSEPLEPGSPPSPQARSSRRRGQARDEQSDESDEDEGGGVGR